MKMNDEEFLKEYRKEADFINNHYGLGDADHVTGLDVGHIYDLMRTYANQSKPDLKDIRNEVEHLIDHYKDSSYVNVVNKVMEFIEPYLQSKPDVSDEEIENYAYENIVNYVAFINGAKWMRNKLTKF